MHEYDSALAFVHLDDAMKLYKSECGQRPATQAGRRVASADRTQGPFGPWGPLWCSRLDPEHANFFGR